MTKSTYSARRLNVGCEPQEVASRLCQILVGRRSAGGPYVLGVVSTPKGLQWVISRWFEPLAERIQLNIESHVGTYTKLSSEQEICEDVAHWVKSTRRAA